MDGGHRVNDPRGRRSFLDATHSRAHALIGYDTQTHPIVGDACVGPRSLCCSEHRWSDDRHQRTLTLKSVLPVSVTEIG